MVKAPCCAICGGPIVISSITAAGELMCFEAACVRFEVRLRELRRRRQDLYRTQRLRPLGKEDQP